LVLRTLCEERLRREPRDRQRELALFSARALCAAQNDVMFMRTHARKVLVKFFQKLAGSKGRALGVLPYKHQFILRSLSKEAKKYIPFSPLLLKKVMV